MYSKIFVSALFSIVFALAAVAAPPPDSIDHATSATSVPRNSSAAKVVFKTVTTVDGDALTIITSKGGKGFTLTPLDDGGVVTTMFGSVYTVATDGVTPTSSDSPTSSGSATPSSSNSTMFIVVLVVLAVCVVLSIVAISICRRKRARAKKALAAAAQGKENTAARPYYYSSY